MNYEPIWFNGDELQILQDGALRMTQQKDGMS